MSIAQREREGISGDAERRWRWGRMGVFIVVGGLFVAAIVVLGAELREYHYRDMLRQVGELSPRRLGVAVALVGLSYLLMTAYDHLGLRYIKRQQGFIRTTFGSFIGYAFTNNLGAFLGAGTVRLRIYSGWGLSSGEILALMLFNAASVWLGLLTAAGLSLFWMQLPVPEGWAWLSHYSWLLGIVILLPIVAYLAAALFLRHPVNFGYWVFRWPPFRLAASQVGIGAFDWLLAATVLFLLLPPDHGAPFALVVGAFLLAQTAGLISHVPGGLGVFETVLLLLLAPMAPHDAILGALLVYRGIYYLLPLAVASGFLSAHEVVRNRRHLDNLYSGYQRWVGPVAPAMMSVLVYLMGVSLLVGGGLPVVGERLRELNVFVPRILIEAAHVGASVIGALLLFVAIFLHRRLSAGYLLAVALLGTAAILSLLRGLHWETGLAAGLTLALLFPCRGQFYRKAPMFGLGPGWLWVAAIALGVGVSLWIGVLFTEPPHSPGELLWPFVLEDDAARFLRSALGGSLTALVVSFIWCVYPPVIRASRPGTAEMEEIIPLIRAFPNSYAHLALDGDKQLLFNETRTGFVLFAIRGKTWVAMGEPVAPPDQQAELAWRFRELCARHRGRPVFYHIAKGRLPTYLDMGLSLLRIGEEGRVPLEPLSPQEEREPVFTKKVKDEARKAWLFEVLPMESVPKSLPELREIFQAWAEMERRDRRSSPLSTFNPAYFSRFPLAIVREEGRMIAFGTVWRGADEELSIGMVRMRPESSSGVLDFLFAGLMQWGRDEGFRWFNLGSAPLAARGERILTPRWRKVGSRLYRHGEHFDSVEEMRAFKDRFHPIWQPKYLAGGGGRELPWMLMDLIRLVSVSPEEIRNPDSAMLSGEVQERPHPPSVR